MFRTCYYDYVLPDILGGRYTVIPCTTPSVPIKSSTRPCLHVRHLEIDHPDIVTDKILNQLLEAQSWIRI